MEEGVHSLETYVNSFKLSYDINHPFIISLQKHFNDTKRLYVLTNYISGGNLYYHRHKNFRFRIDQAKFMISQIILAIGHLH